MAVVVVIINSSSSRNSKTVSKRTVYQISILCLLYCIIKLKEHGRQNSQFLLFCIFVVIFYLPCSLVWQTIAFVRILAKTDRPNGNRGAAWSCCKGLPRILQQGTKGQREWLHCVYFCLLHVIYIHTHTYKVPEIIKLIWSTSTEWQGGKSRLEF